MCQIKRIREMFVVRNLEERGYLDDQGVNRKIVMESFINQSFGRAWIGLIWIRIETGDGFILTR
jgi:hypothetical protein